MKTLKKTINSALVLFFFAAQLQTPVVYAAPAISISAPAAMLWDAGTNRIIYSKSRHRKRAPASTTKVLTSMVVMDHLSLNKVITIPSWAEKIQPSKIYLRGGEKYYVRDLIRSLLLSSANDSAEVLAVAVAGSRSRFSSLMNKKVRAIGGRNSNFIRPSGLPAKGQYSTAHDLALIMNHAQKYSFIVKTMKKKHMVIRSLGGRKITLKNHNKMLWKDKREIIGKTGWTRRARHCFVGSINAFNKHIMVAIMGSHSLWRDLKKLVDYQFGLSYLKIKKNQKIWATNREVRQVQLALKRAGYSPGPIDGKFGPMTVKAAERFQRAKGLDPDGIVGTLTWKKLRAYI